MKIIDSHVHVYPEFLQKEFDRLAQREPWFALLASSKVQKWGTAEELVAAMDETGVESSLVTTFAFRDQGLCREMNDYVLDAARRFPGRILPLAVVSPARPGALEEAERAFDAGALGLGELFPDGQSFTLSDTLRLRGLCALCEDARSARSAASSSCSTPRSRRATSTRARENTARARPRTSAANSR